MNTRRSKSPARKRRTFRTASGGALRSKAGWETAAYRAGVGAVGSFKPLTDPGEPPASFQWARHLNEAWGQWFRRRGFASLPRSSYPIACRRFRRGFCGTAHITVRNDMLLPTPRTVGCVITAMNEASSLHHQLNELMRLPFDEVIVVLNGTTDSSYEIVRSHPIRATVVYYEPVLGYDVGRAVGAKMSRSDMVLFLDGDMSIGIDRLLPFIFEAERGADVVLNPLTPLLPIFQQWDAVSKMKQFLNVCLGRKDLQADSLTAIPHVLSRNAIERLGASVLAVPPLAQSRAIRFGLTVAQASQPVDVIRLNRIRKHNVGPDNPVEQLIIGDHLEALHECMAGAGARCRFPDDVRQRHRIVERREELVRENEHRDRRA